jgi:hypothetical protein
MRLTTFRSSFVLAALVIGGVAAQSSAGKPGTPALPPGRLARAHRLGTTTNMQLVQRLAIGTVMLFAAVDRQDLRTTACPKTSAKAESHNAAAGIRGG